MELGATLRQPAPGLLRAIRGAVFAAALLPALRLLHGWNAGSLGPNPVEALTQATGEWTLNFLWLTLAITPLRVVLGLPWLLRLRRMLGLWAFAYGVLHGLIFLGFEHGFEMNEIARDILRRPFVTIGVAALALMLPLAVTSHPAAIRWLGGRRWQELHRSVYLIGILAIVHYLWLVKITAILAPLGYALVLALLLGWRARERMRRARPFAGAAVRHGTEPGG